MIAKKSFGQHFLQDQSVIKKILAAAEITSGETVIEVGPGHGVLTEALVRAGAKLVAIEADRDLIPKLRQKFQDGIQLVYQDILKWQFEEVSLIVDRQLKIPYKMVANLPYNIASAVIEKFLTADHPPTRMVVMVQKEVADRILAKPGEMSVLSVACQVYAEVKRVVNVPPGAFRPAPKVESTVVRMDIRNRERGIENGEYEPIIALAKAGFRSRRKQLHRNLAEAGVASSDQVKAALRDLGLPETARAQELSVEEWTAMASFSKRRINQ